MRVIKPRSFRSGSAGGRGSGEALTAPLTDKARPRRGRRAFAFSTSHMGNGEANSSSGVLAITPSCLAPTAAARLDLQCAKAEPRPGTAIAMNWYVNSKTGAGAQDGRSPGTAFKTLGQAI